MEPADRDELRRVGPGYLFIASLIQGSYDLDRMDYLNRDALHIQHQIRRAVKFAALRRRLDHDLRVGSARDQHGAFGIAHIAGDRIRVASPSRSSSTKGPPDSTAPAGMVSPGCTDVGSPLQPVAVAPREMRRVEDWRGRSDATVELSVEQHRSLQDSHIVDVTLVIHGQTLRSSAAAPTGRWRWWSRTKVAKGRRRRSFSSIMRGISLISRR